MHLIATSSIVSLLCTLVVRADSPPACKDTNPTDTGKGFAAFEQSTAVWKWDGDEDDFYEVNTWTLAACTDFCWRWDGKTPTADGTGGALPKCIAAEWDSGKGRPDDEHWGLDDAGYCKFYISPGHFENATSNVPHRPLSGFAIKEQACASLDIDKLRHTDGTPTDFDLITCCRISMP